MIILREVIAEYHRGMREGMRAAHAGEEYDVHYGACERCWHESKDKGMAGIEKYHCDPWALGYAAGFNRGPEVLAALAKLIGR